MDSGEKIVLYSWNNNKYISGYDYSKVNKEVVMGIDSLMSYYPINSELFNKIKDSYDIEIMDMPLRYRAKIRTRHYDDFGDAIYRMKTFSYEDLLIWKQSMEDVMNTSMFDGVQYHLLCKEIAKREEKDMLKEELLNKICFYLASLKDEYGDMVYDVIKSVPKEMDNRKQSK